MSRDFYAQYIIPYNGIIIKMCRAYTNTEEDFEDYYQEVCLQIWRSKESFRQESEWSTWIYRLTLNVCLTLMKQKKRSHKEFSSDYLPEELHEDLSSQKKEDIHILYDAIRQLPELDRGIILLYLEEKPYEIIAQITGLKANNVGVRIGRVKEKLKKKLHGKVN